ncbi:MAG: GNAT family N-acetyltransferase [Fibrobacteria bacterium]
MTSTWISPELMLTGGGVELVPLAPDHIPGLYRAGKNPELWRFVPFAVASESDMGRYVSMALADRDRGEGFPFTIRHKADGRILGSSRYYSLSPQNRNLEIGYTWLDPSVWRTAVNTECKLLLLRHAFESLGCVRVALRTDLRNLRSRNAIERLGATLEGVLRKHMILPDGYIRDTVYFSITDEEWPQVKNGLAARLVDA